MPRKRPDLEHAKNVFRFLSKNRKASPSVQLRANELFCVLCKLLTQEDLSRKGVTAPEALAPVAVSDPTVDAMMRRFREGTSDASLSNNQ